MCVALGHGAVAVPEDCLNDRQAYAALDEPRGARMAQRVEAELLVQLREPNLVLKALRGVRGVQRAARVSLEHRFTRSGAVPLVP